LIGQKIYYFRKLKGITQKQLSQGICSVPHLSKIENLHEYPSADILKQLCNRLGISSNEIDSQRDLLSINLQLDEWYTKLISGNKEEATQQYSVLVTQIALFQEPDVLLKFNLLTIRYYLLLRDFDEASKMFKELQPFIKKLSSKLKYYYYLFNGIYFSFREDYLEALHSFNEAERVQEELKIQDPEIFYRLAQVNLNMYRTYYSNKYADIALEIFDRTCNYVRSIDCQILLSINLTRQNNYAQAEKHLLNAQQLSRAFNNNEQLSIIYHNLGYLYFVQGYFQQAIKFFADSLNYSYDEEHEKNVRTYHCLARSHYILNDVKTANYWLEKGNAIANHYNLTEFVHHYNALKCQYNPDDNQLENVLKNDVIPYFEKKHKWYHVAEYSEILANEYSKRNKYKYSSHYYSLVNEARKSINMF
jgi:transcriptional regulator with XRE-family HTH domain